MKKVILSNTTSIRKFVYKIIRHDFNGGNFKLGNQASSCLGEYQNEHEALEKIKELMEFRPGTRFVIISEEIHIKI